MKTCYDCGSKTEMGDTARLFDTVNGKYWYVWNCNCCVESKIRRSKERLLELAMRVVNMIGESVVTRSRTPTF